MGSSTVIVSLARESIATESMATESWTPDEDDSSVMSAEEQDSIADELDSGHL